MRQRVTKEMPYGTELPTEMELSDPTTVVKDEKSKKKVPTTETTESTESVMVAKPVKI